MRLVILMHFPLPVERLVPNLGTTQTYWSVTQSLSIVMRTVNSKAQLLTNS